MTKRFIGKSALVTGSSSGIGAATAKRLAAEGANVAIVYHSHKEWAEEVAAECERYGVRTIVLYADLHKPEDAESIVKATAEAFGGLDVLVNNAGQTMRAKLLEVSYEDWDATFDINVKGYLATIKAAIPYMLEKGEGAIVNVASTSGWFGGQGTGPAYVASKHAIHGLTRQVVCEYGPLGIRCNTVCPGLTDTPMVEQQLKVGSIREAMKKIPGRRVGLPEDLANLIAFLCSSEAEYIHGANVLCDGGLFESRTALR